jgi:dienelactone hydrolase
MIHAYLAAQVKQLDAKFLDGAKSKEEWEKAKPRLKREFLEMLGLDPLPERTPLKATVTGTLEKSGVTIEKVHYQSKPGLYVTGNLYLPKASDKKHPAILYVCGHSNKGRDGNKTAYQDHGLWFAKNGYVCLVVDTLQLGEIAGIHHGTYREGRWWWHDRGYTPAGVECWNGIRGIDYMVSRPEVNAERIGVTGISGGGATTVWVAAADERVKVAVPVSGMSDLECYVTDKVVNGHCDCMFAHNTYQWEWTTILALFAPKPMLFTNSDNDSIFPMSGNRRIAAKMRKCYEMLGAKDQFDDYVSKGGHAYRPDLRVAIFQFFERHLKGTGDKVADELFTVIPGKDLRVFPEDTDLPEDAINAKVDETFVPVAKVDLPEAGKFKEWKAGLVKQLREKCFRALPERIPKWKSDSPPTPMTRIFSSENSIEFCGMGIVGGPGLPGIRSSLLVLNPDEDPKAAALWHEKRFPRDLAYGVYPRGGNQMRWTTKSPPNTVERSLPLIGQTVDSGRVRDVASFLVAYKSSKERMVGRGPAGILAAYASIFVSGAIDELIIIDPPLSHRDGPHFLNVLRVLDIPEALGLLAPEVKLTLTGKNAKDKAFDKTAAIYKLAGAEEKFKRE